jgi:hypothetical protein
MHALFETEVEWKVQQLQATPSRSSYANRLCYAEFKQIGGNTPIKEDCHPADIPEFESRMPSHSVRSLDAFARAYPGENNHSFSHTHLLPPAATQQSPGRCALGAGRCHML